MCVRKDSNPQPSEPKSDVLSSWTTNAIAYFFSISLILSAASCNVFVEKTSRPDSLIILAPSSELVPWSLTTIGIFISPIFLYAWTTPLATLSHRTIPPKIFSRIALTFLSFRIILNPASTVSALAVPPTSKKFAGSPPESFISASVSVNLIDLFFLVSPWILF